MTGLLFAPRAALRPLRPHQETALAARDGAMVRELDEARRISGDFDREAFVAWFGRMRAERARLADAIREAEARTAAARTTLAHQRVAETAEENAVARRRGGFAADLGPNEPAERDGYCRRSIEVGTAPAAAPAAKPDQARRSARLCS